MPEKYTYKNVMDRDGVVVKDINMRDREKRIRKLLLLLLYVIIVGGCVLLLVYGN